jgi:uncharacterized protein
MKIQRFDRIQDFAAQAGSFLAQREAENNVLLGTVGELLEEDAPVDRPPYLATVEEQGRVIGAALCVPPSRLMLSSLDWLAIPALARDVHDRFETLSAVGGESGTSRVFAQEWQQLTGRDFRIWLALRIFALTSVRPVKGVTGHLRLAGPPDRGLLVDWLDAFEVEALGQSDRVQAEQTADKNLAGGSSRLFLWEDGETASMAGCGGPTPNGIRVRSVYTPPRFRRRGYASACVSALSQRLLDEGRRFCFLATDLANPTSNHIYQEIGYEPVIDMNEIVFDQDAS